MTDPKDHYQPVVLYVERVDTEPTLVIGVERRKTVFDIEMTQQQMQQIINAVQKRDPDVHKGAIRIRFIGRVFV